MSEKRGGSVELGGAGSVVCLAVALLALPLKHPAKRLSIAIGIASFLTLLDVQNLHVIEGRPAQYCQPGNAVLSNFQALSKPQVQRGCYRLVRRRQARSLHSDLPR
jgi:hypothetical protein